MKRFLNIMLSALLIVLVVLSAKTFSNFGLLMMSLLFYFVLFYVVYKITYKFEYYYTKGHIIIYSLFLIIFNGIQLLLTTNYNFNFMIMLLFNNLAAFLAYLNIKRRVDYKNALFSLFLIILGLPLLLNTKDNSIVTLVMVVYSFLLVSVDYSYPKSKKSFIKYLLLGVSLGMLININYYFLVPMILFIPALLRNVGKKITVLAMIAIAIGGCTGYYLFNIKCINDVLVLNNNLNINEYLYKASYYEMTSILIIGLLFTIINSVYKGYKKVYEPKNNIYYLLVTTILFSLYVLGYDSYLNSIFFVSLFVFATNYCSIRSTVIVLYHKRLKKPSKIEKVSVVIPNYNYAKYIVQRIDSVVNQTYPIGELIILDDMSTDDSVKVINKKIKELKKSHPELPVRFIPNEVNSGNVFKQWQKAFEESQYDYLWIAEADDLCSKYFLNVIMQGFEKDDNVIMSYCESTAIDQDDITFKDNLRDWIDQFGTNHWKKNYINYGKKELEEVMCTNNTIANASSLVFKKSKLINVKKIAKEAQDYRLAGDWYFYAKYLQHGSLAYSCDSLNYHRIHRNSVTTTTDNFKRYNEVKAVQEMIDNDIKLSANAKKRIKVTLDNMRRDFAISDDEIKYSEIKLSDIIKKKKIKDEILLSIIIPVYNVEAYLKKCLNSFMNTLPEKTEVIIINDGSPDNSEAIIKEYAKKYSQIKYIKKKNGGLSSVKNVGLREAKGKYIIFLDSDDYVASNMYSTMLKKALDTDSDIVYSDVMVVYEDGRMEYSNMTNYNRDSKLMQVIDRPLMAASWNKMIKRELYDGLEFPEGINNEDVAVSPLLFIRSKKTTKICSPFYKYLQRTGSIQNSGFNEKRFMIFDTTKMILDKVSHYNKKIQEEVTGAVITHQVLGILIFAIGEIENKDERIKFISMFCDRYNELGIDSKNNKYIMEYLKFFKMTKLIDCIESNNIYKIDRIIR